MVGHNSRRAPGPREIRRLIDDGALGRVVAAEANFSSARGLDLSVDTWRAACPALPLMQLGIHEVDSLNYLLGTPVEVSALFGRGVTKTQADDVTSVLIRYESGVVAHIGSYSVTPHTRYLHVFGTDASAKAEHLLQLTIFPREGEPSRNVLAACPHRAAADNTIIEELEEFGECIRSGKTPETGAGEALTALAVVEAAIRSADSGKVEKVK